MRKLSDYQDEEALDLLAEIMEPAAEILADAEVKEEWQGARNRIKLARMVIKKHKKAVMEILAAMEGVPVQDYHCNIFTLPARVIEILNDDELLTGFTSQAQEMMQGMSSGPATVNTGESEN